MNIRMPLLPVLLGLCFLLVSCSDGPTSPEMDLDPTSHAPTAAVFSEDGDASGMTAPDVTTDKDDYQPGDTVTITGSGWEAGETVHIHISEDPETEHNPHDFQVEADDEGNFVHAELVMDEVHLGVTFSLTATGESSGDVAEWMFTDGNPQSIEEVSGQTSAQVQPGGAATFTIRVSFAGNNTACRVTLSVEPVAGLSFSFSENPVEGQGSGMGNPAVHPESELTVTVAPSAEDGEYELAVQGSNDSDCQGPGPDELTLELVVESPAPADEPTTTTVSDATATYGDGTVTLSAAVTGGDIDAGEVTFTVMDGTTTIGTAISGDVEEGETAVEYTLPPGTDAGTYSIEASYGGAPGFESSVADPGTLTIDQLDITGTFEAENKVYDGNTGATVLIRSLNGVIGGDNVSLSGGTAAFEDPNVGTNKIVTLSGAVLSGSDANNYALTSVAQTTADITALGISGSFTADNKEYDGNTSATVQTTSLTDVFNNDDVTLTGGTATFDNKNVGTGKTVTLADAGLSGPDAGNYSLTSVSSTTADITAKDVTGSFTAENREYDGTTDATVLSRTVDGGVVDDDVSLDGGTASFGDKNVGENKTVTLTGASLSGSDAGNYNLTSVATATADITPLGITGNFEAGDKEYDGNTSATFSNPSVDGVLGDDDVTLTGGTATFDDKNVGEDKTVTLSGATLSGADAGNYGLDADPTTTADITAKDITGTFTADDKEYDGNASATALTTSLSDVVGTDDVALTGGTATFEDKNVGEDKIVTLSGATLSGADAGNYDLTSVATTTADITPKDLEATADDVTRNFSETNPVVLTSVSYDGFVSGEGPSDLDPSTPQLSTTYQLGEDAGTYPITWDDPPGIDSPNYEITLKDGTLTIVDDVAPVVSDITLDPTFVLANDGTAELRALVDDSGTGNSTIEGAQYEIRGLTGWIDMSLEDGSVDSSTEWFTATIGSFDGPTVLDICVRGTDSAGNTSEDSCGFLAVVDPSEGFVTGGGWIDSPLGAYYDEPGLVGKANFGFVSRYKRGANTPDGNTQFQFKAGELNFHSTSYEWLVVSGGSGRAQFKGEGRLNGEPGYSFTLTVIDADMSGSNGGDKFRIKITNGSGSPVYDNDLGMDDSGDPTTTLGGGSIVIHSGGNGNGNANGKK